MSKSMLEYLPLFLLIFSGLIYLVKLWLNWDLKKRELIFDKTNQAKIEQLKQFYKSYINLEHNLKNLHFASSQNLTDSETIIRQKLTKNWKQFYLDFTFLKIFLKRDEVIIFEKLKFELDNIQQNLDFYKIDRHFGESDRQLMKELRKIRDEVFPVIIPELLNLIEINLKKDFKIEI